MKTRMIVVLVLTLMLALLASDAGAQGTSIRKAQEPQPASPDDSIYSVQDTALNVELVGQYVTWGASGVVVQGNYAYVADMAYGLRVIDISDPSSPVEAGSFDTYWARDVVVDGIYAYVADDDDGLRVINISDPAHPFEYGSYETLGEAYGVAVDGTYAYLATQDIILEIVRISDLTGMESCLYSNCWVAHGRDVVVRGDYAYLAGTLFTGLAIFDVTNPITPTQLSDIGYGDSLGVAVVERDAHLYVYLASEDTGLEIVEVTDPVSPTLLSTFDTLDAQDVAVAGNYAYIADGARGLRVVDVADPVNPTEAGYYIPADVNAWANGVAVVGNYVYVADYKAGLRIYWYAPPATASIPVSGGALTSPADNVTYVFPSGAFTDTVVITHVPHYPGNAPSAGALSPTGIVFDVTAVYASSGQRAALAPGHSYAVAVQYTDGQLNGVPENSLALYYRDGAQWVKEPTSAVDTTLNTLTATPDHFSLWAVLGSQAKQIFLPLAQK